MIAIGKVGEPCSSLLAVKTDALIRSRLARLASLPIIFAFARQFFFKAVQVSWHDVA
jgi:hypothetical protein